MATRRHLLLTPLAALAISGRPATAQRCAAPQSYPAQRGELQRGYLLDASATGYQALGLDFRYYGQCANLSDCGLAPPATPLRDGLAFPAEALFGCDDFQLGLLVTFENAADGRHLLADGGHIGLLPFAQGYGPWLCNALGLPMWQRALGAVFTDEGLAGFECWDNDRTSDFYRLAAGAASCAKRPGVTCNYAVPPGAVVGPGQATALSLQPLAAALQPTQRLTLYCALTALEGERLAITAAMSLDGGASWASAGGVNLNPAPYRLSRVGSFRVGLFKATPSVTTPWRYRVSSLFAGSV